MHKFWASKAQKKKQKNTPSLTMKKQSQRLKNSVVESFELKLYNYYSVRAVCGDFSGDLNKEKFA